MPDELYCYLDIAKGNMFCNAMFLFGQAEEIFGKLRAENYLHGLEEDGFAIRLAYYFSEINALHPFRDAHVIIGTRLEKPSKINGFALLSPIFLSHAGWREDGAVHINTYYTESQMGLCA